MTPVLLYFEVANALYRYVRHSMATLETAQALLEQALYPGIHLYADPDLLWEVLLLAHAMNLPATYNAHYLARRLDAELWTADRRLAQKVAYRCSRHALLCQDEKYSGFPIF